MQPAHPDTFILTRTSNALIKGTVHNIATDMTTAQSEPRGRIWNTTEISTALNVSRIVSNDVVLQNINAPLLCIYRCFGTSLSGLHPNSRTEALALFSLVQSMQSFESTRALLARWTLPWATEIRNRAAYVIRSFLLVVECIVKTEETVRVFLQLDGCQLMLAALEVCDDLEATLNVLTSGEMGNFSSRLINLISAIAEYCSIGWETVSLLYRHVYADYELLQFHISRDFLTSLFIRADGVLRLSIFNCIATVLLGARYEVRMPR